MADRNTAGKALTVKDVARHAGVSPMTVSRTLAGVSSVREDLQQLVFAAVRELGYVRNETARSLRPGQPSGLIGVVITNLEDPYFSMFAVGVEQAVAQSGRRVLLGNSGADPSRERQLISDFIARKVDGLVVAPIGRSSEHLQHDRLAGVPLVLAANLVQGLDVDAVLIDDLDGAIRATLSLLDAGHTRVAFIDIDPAASVGSQRLDGFRRAHQMRGIEVDPDLVIESDRQASEAGDLLQRLFDQDRPPTAIFAVNNRNALAVLREVGRRLREGVAPNELPELACFDGLELADLMPIPITLVEHSPRQLGLEVGALLVSRLNADAEVDDASPSRIIKLPVELVKTGLRP